MTNCLTCPTPENYAAVALQLQQTALQTEACLFPLERDLRAGVNRPTLIHVTAAPQVVGTAIVQLSTGSVAFSNSAQTAFNTNFVEGLWEVGASLTATAVGAVDNNTYRAITARIRNATDPASAPNVFASTVSIFEANNGTGMDMQLATTFVIGSGQIIQFMFEHLNVSSNLSIAAGARFWATRLSDATALRVV